MPSVLQVGLNANYANTSDVVKFSFEMFYDLKATAEFVQEKMPRIPLYEGHFDNFVHYPGGCSRILCAHPCNGV